MSVIENSFKIGEYLAKLQARTWLSRAPSSFSSVVARHYILLVTLPNIRRFKIFFIGRLSNKPFLIWLLTTSPHLKYVATQLCNVSLKFIARILQ